MRGRETEQDKIRGAFWVNVCEGRATVTVLRVCGALHVWTVYKKFTVWVYECIYVRVCCISECMAFWVQWECTNGRTLEMKCTECSWSAAKSGFQSCLEAYYLLAIILALFFFPLHFPHFPLRVSLSIYYFHTLFIDWASHPGLHWLLTKSLYPGSENEDTRISVVAGWLWTIYVVPPSPAVQWRERNKGRWHVTTSSLDLYQATAPEAVWMRH